VRLRKGFQNVEKAPFGGLKLRIPTLLFVEKMRTQSRFNVRRAPPVGFALRCIKTGGRGAQLMRTGASSSGDAPLEEPPAERTGKGVHNASSKVSLVVQRMLFPLLEAPMRTHVVLDTEANQVELDLLDQVGRDKPGLMDDQQGLVQHLLSLIERYRWKRGGAYSRVDSGGSGGP
jgi:hypothetical protein